MIYKVIEETVADEELGQRRTYGIAAVTGRISDISDNREFVERLVELLNARQVPLMHFKAVIEDSLT